VRWCAAPNPAEPLIATLTDPVACEQPIPHKCKAVAEVAVDTEALVCSGSRCSSP
jgi:hypothetical protein